MADRDEVGTSALEFLPARPTLGRMRGAVQGCRGCPLFRNATRAVFKEIERLRPQVLVLLGATAAQTLLGRDFRVTERRGEVIETPLAPYTVATIHPSAILRMRTREEREREMARFTADLAVAAGLLSGAGRFPKSRRHSGRAASSARPVPAPRRTGAR